MEISSCTADFFFKYINYETLIHLVEYQFFSKSLQSWKQEVAKLNMKYLGILFDCLHQFQANYPLFYVKSLLY